MTKIPSLDILRAIACLLVLFDHLFSVPLFAKNLFVEVLPFTVFLQGGFIGVDIFFVLSGFLITGILYEEYEKKGNINFFRFYVRRFLRLYPAIVVAFFVFAIPIYLNAGWKQCILNFGYLFTYTTLLPKYFEVLNFFPRPVFFPTGWSLSIEEFFYIFFPLSFAIILRYLIRYFTFSLILALFSIYISNQYLNGGAYHNPIWHMFSISLGSLGALAFKKKPNHFMEAYLFQYLQSIGRSKKCFVLCVIVIALFFFFTSPKASSLWIFGSPILSLSILQVVIHLTVANYMILEKLRFLRWIGTISYGLYLFHYPIYSLMGNYFISRGNVQGEGFVFWFLIDSLNLLLTFFLASISFYFIEKKALALRPI
ncbi:acyltransferase family protein [Leptospira kmetyi]|uniref:acyltransferase family protein n=1 Tax=Leptospira kmetyi TaxID=408139 RepID=UPI0003905CF1|nr:acyltransferase [Leptospira kmetyi]EQA55209.1 acyltransferase [Leptospira kmetyi serovar Malaysia str. Bejo-Iso9]